MGASGAYRSKDKNEKNEINPDNEILLNFSEMAKIFFELYIFKKKLSSEEKDSKEKKQLFSDKCCLIKKSRFKKIKNFYLCDGIFKALKGEEDETNVSFDQSYKKSIINSVFIKQKKKLIENIEKNNNKCLILKDINKINTNEADIKAHDFEIISLKTYKLLNKDKPINEKDIKSEYIINNGKLIIKYNDESLFLIIGNLNNSNDSELFNYEKKVNYKTAILMKEKFELLKSKKYDEQLIKYEESDIINNDYNNCTPLGNKNKLESNDVIQSKNIEIPIPENAEKEIKFLIMYYVNNLELNEKIKLSSSDMNTSFFEEKYYLINKNFINEFKKKYNYEKLNEHIEEILLMNGDINIEVSNSTEESYKKLTDQIFDKLTIKNFINNNNIVSSKLEPETINVEVKDETIKLINIPYNFEILNEKVYSYLNKINNENLIKHDALIKDSKIIFQLTSKIIQNSYHLLINCIYEPSNYNMNYEEIILFKNLDDLKQNFEDMKNRKYELFKQEKLLFLDNLLFKNQDLCKLFILNEELKSNNQQENLLVMTCINFHEEKSKDLDKINEATIKRIKFFIRLFFYYSEILSKINQPIKNQNIEEDYFLVNKLWLDKYKKHYCYDNLLLKFSFWNRDPKIINIYQKYIKNNNNELNDKLIDELFNYKSFELMSCVPANYEEFNNENLQPNTTNINTMNNIQYYDNYELFSKSMIDSLKLTECDLFKKNDIDFKNITCFFGEKRIFLKYYLNQIYTISIGFLYNNYIIVNEMLINSNDEKNILKILGYLKKNGFENLIRSLSFDRRFMSKINESTFVYLLIKYGATFEIINSILEGRNKDLELLLKIMLFNEELKEEIKSPISKNLINNRIKFKKLHLINVDWFNKYKENSNYDKIYNLILKDKKLYDLFCDKNLSYEKKIKEILNNIDTSKIINKNSTYFCEDQIHIKSEFIKVKKNKSLLYYNNFVLITQEIYDLLFEILVYKKGLEDKYVDCLFGDNKILLIINNKSQYVIEVCSIKNNNTIDIEMFLDYDNSDDPENEIKKLINLGFDKYIKNNTFSQNLKDNISPIFDEKQMILGYAYKYNKKISDYSNYQTNYNLKILINLYICNEQLKIFIESGNEDPHKYYLINKNWLQDYKSYYEFDKIINDVKTNSIIKNMIKDMKENKNIFNSSINDKILETIVNYMDDKIKNKLNKKDDNKFINYYSEEPNNEDFDYIDVHNNKNTLKYYNNFELVSENIYSALFFQKNKNKNIFNQIEINRNNNYYLECYSMKNKKLVIKLPKINNKERNILEVVEIDENNNTFIPQYFFIYYYEETIRNHISYIKNRFKFEDYIFMLDVGSNKSTPFYENDNEKQLGEICKYHKKEPKKDDNFNNNFKPENFVEKKYNSIKEEFRNPPLVGAQNVGATCYMNATIQCFSQIEKLVDYFKYDPEKKVENIIYVNKLQKSNCLTTSFKNLIDNFWPSENFPKNKYQHKNSNNKYFAPYEFKEKISKMDPLFAGARANDSKDLVNFIIMTLHQELNEIKMSNENNNQLINNQNMMYNIFLQQSRKENNSIISDIFYAINGSIMQCTFCQEIKINYQNYFFLTFPLEEVRLYKQKQQMIINQNMFMMMNFQPNFFQINQNDSVTIYDCFEYYQQFEFMEGENSIHCNKCQCLRSAQYRSFLVTCPKILIIVLNRGKGIEFNVKLEFDEKLSLQNYININEEKKFDYELIGVVTHMGLSGATGHFIACCKSPINNMWYKYNDDLVTPIYDVKMEVVNYAMPYILFYQKK